MNYVGITVGPILDTMEMTSSPAGVWFSSYLFSIIVRDLCQGLQERGYEVFSLPKDYVVKNHLQDCLGIGMYYDRIYACSKKDPEMISADIAEIRKSVLLSRASELQKCNVDGRTEMEIYEELNSYILLHFIILNERDTEEKGIIHSLGDSLDCLELSKNVRTSSGRLYMYQVMYGTKAQGSNIFMRKYPPLVEAAKNPDFLLAIPSQNDIEIHNIEYLSTLGKMNIDASDTNKINRYFAVVQCDGDNMGLMLTEGLDLKEPEKQKERQQLVTQHCIRFSESVIKDISAYGGFAIYAGGDDLLFMAPVIGKTGKSIFEFCDFISSKYTESFKDLCQEGTDYTKASFSIGLSINYYKYPLYEAMADARSLLFDVAKKYKEKRKDNSLKNNIAVRIRKASGSSSGFVCWMNSPRPKSKNIFRDYINLLNRYYLTGNSPSIHEKDQIMHSVLYHMETINELFLTALRSDNSKPVDPTRKSHTENVFRNYFDNADQIFGQNMVTEIARFAVDVSSGYQHGFVQGLTSSETGQSNNNELYALTSMLRTAKFVLEERS